MAKFEPEFASIEAFVEFCIDDEKDSFLPGDAQKISQTTGMPMSEVIAKLKEFGLKSVLNEAAKRAQNVRGCHSNDYDKYSPKNGWISGQGIGNASRHMTSSISGFGI